MCVCEESELKIDWKLEIHEWNFDQTLKVQPTTTLSPCMHMECEASCCGRSSFVPNTNFHLLVNVL